MTKLDEIDIRYSKRVLIKVSEEIKDKYLKDFIFTQLEKRAITIKNISQVAHFYLDSISSYLIVIFETPSRNFVIAPQYFNNQDKAFKYRLYICDDFFSLFCFNELYFFKQKSLDSSEDEIIDYLKKFLKIEVDLVKKVSSSTLDKLRKDYFNNSKKNNGLKLITSKNYKRAKYMALYTLFLTIFLSFYLYLGSFNAKKLEYKKPLKTYNSKAVLIDEYINVFENQNIENISISAKKSKLVISAKSKSEIFNRIKKFGNELKLKEINYRDNTKRYEATIVSN